MKGILLSLGICILLLNLISCSSCSNEQTSTPKQKMRQTAKSSENTQTRLRRRSHNMEGMAVLAIEENTPLTLFRNGAIKGEVGTPMADGRVQVVIMGVERKPYFNSMAREAADHEYSVDFMVINRGFTKHVLDVVGGVIYSDSPEPIIWTITLHHGKDFKPSQVPIEFAPGEFEVFKIPTMGREGILQSIGVVLQYQDKTESRFWVSVPSSKIKDISDDR